MRQCPLVYRDRGGSQRLLAISIVDAYRVIINVAPMKPAVPLSSHYIPLSRVSRKRGRT